MSYLVLIKDDVQAVDVYGKDKINDIVSEIEKKATSHVPDVSTKKGRSEIASIAHKVAKSKELLDKLGKELVDPIKAQAKLIDVERKIAKDALIELKERVRRPLTEWEDNEKLRIENCKLVLQSARDLTAALDTDGSNITDSIRLKSLHSQLESLEITEATAGEFETEALRVKTDGLISLSARIAKAEEDEAMAAELEKLRSEQVEKERLAYEQKLKDDAVQEAKLKAEQEAKAQLKQAEIDKQQAIEAEQKRVADEKQRQEQEAKAREANLEHKKSINNQALQGFIAGGIDETVGKQVIALIAKGNIAHIKITY